MEPTVPTFILESDGLFREGLRLILSKTRFRPQGCGIELDDLPAVPTDTPALFIVGIGQADDLLCRRIRDQYPYSVIVAVGDEGDHQCLTGALDDGANAALCTSVTPESLVSSLQAVMNGGVVVVDARLWPKDVLSRDVELTDVQPKADARESLTISDTMPSEAENEPHTATHLSAREIAILERIVQGDSNKHVARFFKIAEATVKAHVKAIFRKIGAKNRTQAAIWALNHGLFDGINGGPHDISLLIQHEAGAGPESRNDLSPAEPAE